MHATARAALAAKHSTGRAWRAAACQRTLSSAAKGLVNVDYRQQPAGEVAVVTMARNPVNSLSGELINELWGAIRRVEDEGRVNGMVLASSAKAFSAGLDLSEVYQRDEAHFKRFWLDFEQLWSTLYLSPLATVAAIESHAIAGGSVLALACDFRVVADTDSLKMGLTEAQLGMVCPRWLQTMCARTIGDRNAEYLLQRGAVINPAEALSYGFVDETVPKENVMERALAELNTLIAVPPRARAAHKRQQRGYVSAMAGADSAEELWQDLCSAECRAQLDSAMAGLKGKKK